MNNDDEKYLQEAIQNYYEKIKNRVVKLYRKAIKETIYDSYSPTHYERTEQMLNNIDIKLEGNKIIVYTDTNNMKYYSAVDNKNVTELVPWMLEQTGHMDGTGIKNMYHYYPERHYLERAKELIKSEFPEMDIQIINDEPSVF